MNKHSNIFKTYAKQNRETHQLEDDLTRALSICFQENQLFLHEFLKATLSQEDFNTLFYEYAGKEPIEIDIQRKVQEIKPFKRLYGVAISGIDVSADLKNKTKTTYHEAITDLFLRIDDIVIIVEVKPHGQNCSGQLYNQAINALVETDALNDFNNIEPSLINEKIELKDFNWTKLMKLAVRVNNFQGATQQPSRILGDFISFIKMHNYSWLPQLPLSQLKLTANTNEIEKRIKDAINNSDLKELSNRTGFNLDTSWASELLIYFDKENVVFVVYAGNTKKQGEKIYTTDSEPFKEKLTILGQERTLHKKYHLKFYSQGYITGLNAEDSDLNQPKSLNTKDNFIKYAGKHTREEWPAIEQFLDHQFKESYNWKKEAKWQEKIINTNRTQFYFSLGYELLVKIPFTELKEKDTTTNNLEPLIQLLNEVKTQFEHAKQF